MGDFIIILLITTIAISILMETIKEIVEAIGNKIKKREIEVSAWIWRVISFILVIGGVLLSRGAFLKASKELVGLSAVFVEKYMLGIWMPIVWWGQLQLNMKVIREFLGPFLEKLVYSVFRLNK